MTESTQPLSKLMCQHSIGFDHEERELFGWLEFGEDPSKTLFNYCPWCGAHVGEIVERLKTIPNKDDCIRGGCED